MDRRGFLKRLGLAGGAAAAAGLVKGAAAEPAKAPEKPLAPWLQEHEREWRKRSQALKAELEAICERRAVEIERGIREGRRGR